MRKEMPEEGGMRKKLPEKGGMKKKLPEEGGMRKKLSEKEGIRKIYTKILTRKFSNINGKVQDLNQLLKFIKYLYFIYK